MDKEDVLRQLKPKLHRLKELGTGVRVTRVLGERVLVRTVIPLTELDEYEKKGLAIPENVRQSYTPLPTTGIVVGVGERIPCIQCENPQHSGDHFSYLGLRHDFEPRVREGDMILFPRLSGMDFTIAEQDLRIIHINDILAVLTDTDMSVMEIKYGE